MLHDSKRTILATSLSAELYMLSNWLGPHLGAAPLVARFYAAVVVPALREVMACFPVYRTYIRPEEGMCAKRIGGGFARRCGSPNG